MQNATLIKRQDTVCDMKRELQTEQVEQTGHFRNLKNKAVCPIKSENWTK